MNTTCFTSLRRWFCVLVLVLVVGALILPTAHGQGMVKPSVTLLNELVLPPIDDNGNPFFDLPTPTYLEGPDKGRYRAHFVLTPNTNAYTFVLDASSSTGSNSIPLTFQWGYFLGDATNGIVVSIAGPSTSPYYTNDPPAVDNSTSDEMALDVSNGFMSERLWFGVGTLTPQEATDAMIEWIDVRYPQPLNRAQRKLLPLLREASAHFAAGETDLAKTSLALFVRKLSVSRNPLTRNEARCFKALAKIIIATAA